MFQEFIFEMDGMENADSNIEIDPNFEPQMRARSNTWPLPRPENYIDIKVEPGDDGGQCSELKPDGKGALGPKKNSSRRNAWGNTSYAELITMAIDNSPEKRLTLSQIYDWMVENVPYFKDKGDSNSSAGWKNSIRHNLSLHKCFVRTQNEGTGKSSWWTLDPTAKSDRRTERRRTSSMDTKKYEKRKEPLKKKVEAIRNGLKTASSPCSSISESLDAPNPAFFPMTLEFRPRASSNASSCGRLSPIPSVQSDVSDDQNQQNLMSNWNSEMFNRPNDRYETDQLVNSLTETMKLSGSGANTDSNYLVELKTSPVGSQLSPMGFGYGSHFNGSPAGSRFGTSTYTTGSTVEYGSFNNPSTPHCSPQQQQQQSNITHLTPLTPATTSYSLTTLQTVSPSQTNHSLSPTSSSHDSVGTTATAAGLDPPVVPLEPLRSASAYSCRSPQPNYRALSATPQGPSTDPSMLRAALTTKESSSPCSCCPPPMTTQTTLSVSATTSHVMGHLLAINNPMPNDLDLNLDTLSGGLECDVDQVIRHELSVDGNLDFNFDPAAAAAAAAAAGGASSLALFRNGRHWVH